MQHCVCLNFEDTARLLYFFLFVAAIYSIHCSYCNYNIWQQKGPKRDVCYFENVQFTQRLESNSQGWQTFIYGGVAVCHLYSVVEVSRVAQR